MQIALAYESSAKNKLSINHILIQNFKSVLRTFMKYILEALSVAFCGKNARFAVIITMNA